ncbi:hypothetical protein GWK47_018914 [Chionoecetes opilio]|uniref:Endonuclease/exonuclease/phosphatase domain-containing protein n=1 Tax=Chionoecetes opilio TaxID=41210 RepID=A0A8J4XUS1_CHIOP|nr:hypothetical protein GWK47_018914 [Chionoecetes opilio]
MYWVLGKVVDQSDCGAYLGNTNITDLVFADDAVIFAESLEVLVMALEALHEEAKPLGLKVSGSRPRSRCLEAYWMKQYSLFMRVLFEITVGDGRLRLFNVYSAPGRINLSALPTPTNHDMIYIGDFNARHSALGDHSPTPNRNGLPLLEYNRRHRLTHWPTGGAAYARGGTLDHIITFGLVASNVKCVYSVV